MAAGNPPLSRLASLSAQFRAETKKEKKALARLEELLQVSRSEDLPGAAVAAGAHPPRCRVFRRAAPRAAATIEVTTPAWGRGAAITETLGPFRGEDGRLFWFDFYPLVRLVPVYLEGESQPAFLFHMRQLRLGLGGLLPIAEALRLLRRRYTLARGSVWLRADLLAPGAPAGSYVGLRVRGGQLSFTPPPVDAGGRLTIPAGGRCVAQLDLETPAVPAAGGGGAGRDVADAEIALPETFSFTLTAGRASVGALGEASWTLYGQRIDFAWRQGASPVYEPQLLSVLTPMSTSEPEIEVRAAASPFAEAAGRGSIRRAGWGLPVATIDVANPVEAAGNGGLAVRAEGGLSLSWAGLRDGPARLRAPWVALAPGLLLITDLQASGRYAHQTLQLWKDADSRFRSTLELSYGDSFGLTYTSAVTAGGGSELLAAQADTLARLDRPVDVKGVPLPVETADSLLLLGYTDDARTAVLYDADILADRLARDPALLTKKERPRSVAIRNALFTVTPVASLLLFARLRDAENAEAGSLLLGMGLYGLLPTLPDPYAANVGRVRGRRSFAAFGRPVVQLLVSTVAWTRGETDENPDALDQVATRFDFAPLVAGEAAPLPPALTPAPTAAAEPDFDRGGKNQFLWDRRFQRFAAEQFALLDVSSNADQMGVSFAWFDSRALNERDGIFQHVYGQGATAAPGSALQVRDLDLTAESRFVRAFTVPQVSWEPLANLTPPDVAGDPPQGFNLFPDDGGPTRLLNDAVEPVPIAPIPVAEHLVRDFEERKKGFTGALFTLPFGLRAFAEFSRENRFGASLTPARLAWNRPEYEGGVKGALQLRVDAPEFPGESPLFVGNMLQLDNLLRADGSPTGAGTLGHSVGIVVNGEFFDDGRGVPVIRIDFSGYGASLFSHWQNPNAAIAATSQVHFDVFLGRTAREVIQVRSLVYPWGIRVVRTITLFRTASAYVFRFDSGWQAESDGVYDFRYNVYFPAVGTKLGMPNPYTFHPGVVKGVFAVRNLRETNAVPPFTKPWVKKDGETYVDADGVLRTVTSGPPPTPPAERNPKVLLQPLYFDADVEIDGVTGGASGGRVPCKGMLGFVQLAPRGEPLPPALFAQLLLSQFGGLGGPVDCVVDIGGSGQPLRVSRVDVNASTDVAGNPIFVSAARGSVVLPKDGAWSVVQHDQGSGEVSPLDPQATVPLVRKGRLLDPATRQTDAGPDDQLRLANPRDLVRPLDAGSRNYGLLQSTGTQKALFRLPGFKPGSKTLFGAPPELADAYRLLNSPGIFPNVQDALPLALGAYETRIVDRGLRLLDPGNPDEVFRQKLPDKPLFLIDKDFLKLYVEYAKKNREGVKTNDGFVQFGFDSTASEVKKQWLSKVEDICMVVDLGPLKRLLTIKGKFDAEKGKAPGFIDPELEFGPELDPVVKILQVLLLLQGGDYKDALAKGLEIAMSNSAESWSYAFHARKEIPLVKFPPGPAYDAPQTPLKLEAYMAVGVYFNEVLPGAGGGGALVPSAGAFLEFGGRLSVMCLSVAAATIYATGSVDLRISADLQTGPRLAMKFGFGVEIVVGLPVVGNVSLLYMVGVEIVLDSAKVSVAGFLLFRGHAELLGGLVSVTIQIEAKGIVERTTLPAPAENRTELIAQVTFGIDISIFLIINISFSQSWQESRQIA